MIEQIREFFTDKRAFRRISRGALGGIAAGALYVAANPSAQASILAALGPWGPKVVLASAVIALAAGGTITSSVNDDAATGGGLSAEEREALQSLSRQAFRGQREVAEQHARKFEHPSDRNPKRHS